MTMTSEMGMVRVDQALENEAEYTVRQLHKAWDFLWPDEELAPPEELEVGVRAMLLQGAVGTEILGALLIAAQRPNLDNYWAYTRGIVRNNIAIACRQAADRRRAALEPEEVPAEVSWATDPTSESHHPWWAFWRV